MIKNLHNLIVSKKTFGLDKTVIIQHILQIWISMFITLFIPETPKMGTLANSEDPDKILHYIKVCTVC